DIDITDEEVKALVRSLGGENLISFMTADENPRILAAAGDMVMNREVGLLAGVVVMILFAYVISVFIIHQINRESSVIGTFYALGVKKKELLVHYVTLPTIITFLGGFLGGVLGFSEWGMALQEASTYSYFSIPVFQTVHPLYLIIYALIMPSFISVAVNLAVVSRHLSKTALSLIRNEFNMSKSHRVTCKSNDFVRNFQLRHMLKEVRVGVIMIVGMFISLLIFMLGLNCFILCKHIKLDSQESTKFKYIYILKYPIKSIPFEGEAYYIESLSKTEFGYTLEISVIGIDDNDKYFGTRPTGKKNGIIIGNSTATKYGLNMGDKFVLTDRAKEADYEFFVEGICDYSAGLSVFMDISNMRELFGKKEDYYNMILSDQALDMEENNLYSVTTRADIEYSSTVFVDLMMPMVLMVTTVSVIVFYVVIYLMLGVMIDRSGFGISLIKIFGFKRKEIRRLYLHGNTVFIAIGAVICIPLSKTLMDSFYPRIVANVACGLNLHFEWYIYMFILVGTMLVYFSANIFLMQKINRITPAMVLKNRE
ncbi:MAG: ABC transporter permease, partial [Lachnospiraceae bacterium]|nr:ABC transporter permease [Lachnospiraceae bacterium]